MVSLSKKPVCDVIVRATGGDYLSLSVSSFTFTPDNFSSGQELSFSALVNEPTLESYSSKIVLSAQNYDDVACEVSIGVLSPIKEEAIIPYADGFIDRPLRYYTAYYDIDYKIEALYVEFAEAGQYLSVSAFEDSSFTDSCCLIEIPSGYDGSKPKIRLKARYKEKTTAIAVEPTFSLEGYRIKAQSGSAIEFYAPWPTEPYAIIDISTKIFINDYVHFARTSSAGIAEDFYLPLRSKSPSAFRKSGLAPTDLAKMFRVSGSLKRPYYWRLGLYYAQYNPISSIKFFDSTEKSLSNYPMWEAALGEGIETFNSIMSSSGIGARLEKVDAASTNNSINFSEWENEDAGLCAYYSAQNYFAIHVSANPYYFRTAAALKGTIVREFGHLLGFPDSAYAESDTLYSYGRDNERVTYFTPSDLATMKDWMGL